MQMAYDKKQRKKRKHRRRKRSRALYERNMTRDEERIPVPPPSHDPVGLMEPPRREEEPEIIFPLRLHRIDLPEVTWTYPTAAGGEYDPADPAITNRDPRLEGPRCGRLRRGAAPPLRSTPRVWVDPEAPVTVPVSISLHRLRAIGLPL